MRELLNILRNNDIEPALRRVDLSNFKDLHVVSQDIARHLEGGDVNNLHFWVF